MKTSGAVEKWGSGAGTGGRFWGALALLAIVAVFGVGCVSAAKDLPNQGVVGPKFEQDGSGQKFTNAGQVGIGLVTPSGAITDADGRPVVDKDGKPIVPNEYFMTSGTGPSFTSNTDASGTRALANNTVIRSIYFSRDPSGKISINSTSGTDITGGIDEFAIDPKTGIITGKGFKFGTSASEPFKASNVSYQTHKDIALALTEAQRAVIIEKLEADRAVAEKAWGVASEAVSNITKIIQIYKNPGAAILP